jgi:DNA gyrase subunit A
MRELKDKYGDKRRTDISDEEIGDVDRGDLIAEEPMVVTISQRGYVKRTALSTYQAQNRGGKGIRGAKLDEEDPLEHVFVSSTHDWLLFFSDRGKVYWQKVYDLPLLARTAKGRALVNLLSLAEDERVSDCLAVRDFPEDRYLIMATKQGLVKKTSLAAYSRPMRGGIIAIQLNEGDELIDVRIVSNNDDVVLGTQQGMSIRFSHHDARPMGRNTRGVRGVQLMKGDAVVGMVVADPEMALLTVCENGYGKRTPFGAVEPEPGGDDGDVAASEEEPIEAEAVEAEEPEGDEAAAYSGNMRYRRQRRGGKGLKDIKTTDRNGPVVSLVAVHESDDILMITAGGKIQRFRASDIRVIGRNTQGVRLIRLDDADRVAALARIPGELAGEADDVSTPEE